MIVKVRSSKAMASELDLGARAIENAPSQFNEAARHRLMAGFDAVHGFRPERVRGPAERTIAARDREHGFRLTPRSAGFELIPTRLPHLVRHAATAPAVPVGVCSIAASPAAPEQLWAANKRADSNQSPAVAF